MKKLYKSAACEPISSGFALFLDGKRASTPLGNPFHMRDAALAKAVAREWQAQGEVIRGETMPLTRIAVIAVDMLADGSQRAAHHAHMLPYAETDLVCYRAGDAPALLTRQAELLDPVVAWACERFGITLRVTQGVIPVSQPAENSGRLEGALKEYDGWRLAALVCAVKPLGSLVLALAFIEGRLDADTAFRLSHLEEMFETEKWGRDDEKEKWLHGLRQELANIQAFLDLLAF